MLGLLANWRLILAGLAAAALVSSGLYVKHLWHVIDGKNVALREASAALKVATAQIADRDATIRSNAEGERHDATQTASFWKGQARAAFTAGVRSHRCPGQPPGVSDDLRATWEVGAFKAAPDVPGEPVGKD